VPLLVRDFVLYSVILFLLIDFAGVADIILLMAPPGGNPLLKGLVASRPSADQKSADKEKRPHVAEPSKAKEAPAVVKPISVIRPPPQPTPPFRQLLARRREKTRNTRRTSPFVDHRPGFDRRLLWGTGP